MKQVIKLGVIGLIAYVVFLFATFPAARAYGYLVEQLPPSVKLYGVKGTVWSGRAELLTLASQQYRNARWRLQPKSLFSGQLLFQLDLDNGQSQLKGGVGVSISGNIVLKELLVQQELVDIQALMQTSATVGGKISGRVESLVASRNNIIDASANFILRDVALLLPRRTEWGDFKVDIDKPESETVIKIDDQGGPLLANGLITINEQNQYDISLAVAAASGASNDLIRGLELFGRAGRDGKTRLKYSGSVTELLGGKIVKPAANDKPA